MDEGQAFHVANVDRDPLRVVLMIKGKEPWNRSFECLHIEWKILFSVGPHEYQTQKFHEEDGIPVLECWTLSDYVLSPGFWSSHHVVPQASCPRRHRAAALPVPGRSLDGHVLSL